ncbi:DUF2235 domain-containing protein [Dokdonella soli]|uniref:DUF2235 domain-containing protein n=1 Tax=Dokdonella soli TaxID=529810 RepID=A0ABN1IC73_9GAMM
MAGRNLVLLFDGTWSKPESNTNVERLRRLLGTPAGGTAQQVEYIPGVGVASGIEHWLGGAFGLGLSGNVEDGYRWLAGIWQPDDAVFLFGFSRGAYTARSLGGMIRKCGLLKRNGSGAVSAADVSTAYDFYRTDIHPDAAEAIDWRSQHSVEIEIRCIGVWETVGALGIPDVASWFPYARARYRFHDTELSSIVKYAYHALALDERRADFAPTLWTRNPATLGPGETLTSKKAGQIEIEQRWFIGSHGDVGGGNDRDGVGRAPDPLPDLALAWLQRKAFGAGLGCSTLCEPPPDADLGVPRDSWREFMDGLYHLVKPPQDRVLGGGVNETVDDSVWQRWRVDTAYRPPSLVQAVRNRAIALPPDITA